jgi:hypothetical protein
VIDGATTFAGGTAVTGPTTPELAVAEPTEFVAVTTTRSVEPTSAADAAYEEPVAPATSEQPEPVESQRCHWYAYAIGAEPVHVPGDAVSVCPSCAVPVIDGAVEFAGGAGGGVTTAVAAEAAVAAPPLFEAVTDRTIVYPTSNDVSVYVDCVAPAMSKQFRPPLSQSRHW